METRIWISEAGHLLRQAFHGALLSATENCSVGDPKGVERVTVTRIDRNPIFYLLVSRTIYYLDVSDIHGNPATRSKCNNITCNRLAQDSSDTTNGDQNLDPKLDFVEAKLHAYGFLLLDLTARL